jgi:hypothetical protein
MTLPTRKQRDRGDAAQHGIASDGLLAAGAAMPHPCCADGRSRMPRSVVGRASKVAEGRFRPQEVV